MNCGNHRLFIIVVSPVLKLPGFVSQILLLFSHLNLHSPTKSLLINSPVLPVSNRPMYFVVSLFLFTRENITLARVFLAAFFIGSLYLRVLQLRRRYKSSSSSSSSSESSSPGNISIIGTEASRAGSDGGIILGKQSSSPGRTSSTDGND